MAGKEEFKGRVYSFAKPVSAPGVETRPPGFERVMTEGDRKAVMHLAALKKTHKEIASLIGIPIGTLTRNFQHELSCGATQVQLNVFSAMVEAALNGNVTAQKEILTNLCGWQGKNRLELTGRDGKDLPSLNPTERAQRLTHIVASDPNFKKRIEAALSKPLNESVIDVTTPDPN